MGNIKELPKNFILICREVTSGAYKDWSNTETIKFTDELKRKQKLAAKLLSDNNIEPDNIERLKYDHHKITEALQMLEGKPFDGHIEPKKVVIEPDMKPFVSNSEVEFRRETVEPVKLKYNFPFLVFCGLTLIAVLGYIVLT